MFLSNNYFYIKIKNIYARTASVRACKNRDYKIEQNKGIENTKTANN